MNKKATFVLDEKLIELIKELVQQNYFKSMKNFVEIAIIDEIEKIKAKKIRAAIFDASSDPMFLADINEIEKDFEKTDFEEA